MGQNAGPTGRSGRFGRPSPAMIVASLALFAALGGTAIAVKNDSVRSQHIADKQVKTGDLARKAVKAKNLARNAVTARKAKFFKESGARWVDAANSRAEASTVELLDFENAGVAQAVCYRDSQGYLRALVTLAATEGAYALFSSGDDSLNGGPEGKLTEDTPENLRELENDVVAKPGQADGAGSEPTWFNVYYGKQDAKAGAAGVLADRDRYVFHGQVTAYAFNRAPVEYRASSAGETVQDGCLFQSWATASQ